MLKDKVIIVSGVGPGMGQALAKIAALEGARVVLVARNEAFLADVTSQITAAGGQAIWKRTDVSSVEDCQAVAAAAVEAYGRVDGLVNSAYLHGDWATCDVADPSGWGALYDVNCVGALRMAQAVLPAMRDAGGGAIVNVSTMATVKPFPGEVAYAASKGALVVLSRHMARDFGRFGIRVNAVRMGWIGGAPVYGHIESQVAAGRPRDEVVGEITSRIALGVIPPEDDCARSVLALLSDQFKVVTGATLDINGGEYMAP